jgi:hypothetical protein
VDVKFAVPDLRVLDGINCEALAIAFFGDERPLHGAFGLIDWRLCGLISRRIVQKRIDGSFKESTLIPGRPRLSMEKLFLFGLGSENVFNDNVLEEVTEHMLRTLTLAQVRTSAIVLPGRGLDRVTPERAMEVFLRVASSHEEHDVATIIESDSAQQRMAPVVERERRKARALNI